VVVLGDFIYQVTLEDEAKMKRVMDLLNPLTDSDIPVYAVLGNHDYEVGNAGDPINYPLAERMEAYLESAGIRVLHNEAVALSASGQEDAPLYLVGIASRLAKVDQPKQAFLGLADAAPRFVVMHHPVSFGEIPAGKAPVAVAGHTHGGQVGVPLPPPWESESKWVPLSGWIEGYGQAGNRLYINRGIGFSVAPVRINRMPEITLFTLETAQDGAL
jgi:predicted MPP superfamily phosphohydrolase